jgi:hypothetical protein
VSNELNKHLAGPQPRVEDFWFSEVQQTFWVGSMDIDGNFEPVNVIKLGGHAA